MKRLRNKRGEVMIIAMLVVGLTLVSAAIVTRGTDLASKNNNLTIQEVVEKIKY